MINERDNSVLSSLMLFFTGIMTGAVVALLYAPNSGDETREQIGGWLHDKGERSRNVVNRLRDKIPGRIAETKETVEGMYRERHT